MNATIIIADGQIKSIVGEEKLSEIRKLLLLRNVVEKTINDFERKVTNAVSPKQTNIIDVINEIENESN